jgi:hypothetical protein
MTNHINFYPTDGKWLIGDKKVRRRKGFLDIRELLRKPDEGISCTTLSPIGDDVLFEPYLMVFPDLPELNDTEYVHGLLTDPDWLEHQDVGSTLNIGGRVPIEKRIVRGLVRRKDELIEILKLMREGRDLDQPEVLSVEQEAPIVSELLRIKRALSNSTFGGKLKHEHNEYDQCRQRVSKRIREAIPHIESDPDVGYIGWHLRENIKTGGLCRYFGDWRNWFLS